MISVREGAVPGAAIVASLLVAVSLLLAPAARAADAADRPEGTVAYAVPDSPAFTFLGTTPAQVSRPGSARDLALGVLSGIGRDGRVNQGFAIDVRPWFLVPGFSISLDNYQKSFWHYVAANAQVSAGTVQATPGADPMAGGDTDVAVGVRLTLWDAGDPMRSGEYTNALGNILDGCAPATPGTPPEQQLSCMRSGAETFRRKWLDEHWNATRLSLGWASGWRAPGSLIEDATWRGHALWIVGGSGVGKWGQLIAQLRYDRNKTLDAHEVSFGARANFGTGSMNGFVEILGRARPGGPVGVDEFDASWSAGAEIRIAERAWISTGFGKSFATDQESDPIVVLASLRWAISNEARLK